MKKYVLIGLFAGAAISLMLFYTEAKETGRDSNFTISWNPLRLPMICSEVLSANYRINLDLAVLTRKKRGMLDSLTFGDDLNIFNKEEVSDIKYVSTMK